MPSLALLNWCHSVGLPPPYFYPTQTPQVGSQSSSIRCVLCDRKPSVFPFKTWERPGDFVSDLVQVGVELARPLVTQVQIVWTVGE